MKTNTSAYKELRQKRVPASRDEIGEKTEWSFFSRRSSHYLYLRKISDDLYVFRINWFLLIRVALYFGLLGLPLVLRILDFEGPNDLIILAAYIAFLCYHLYTTNFRSCYFDFRNGCYWKGSPAPEHAADPFTQCRDYTLLKDIYALQLLEDYRSSKIGTYFVFELNIIKKDASRLNVIGEYRNLSNLLEYSKILSERLHVPLWDRTIQRKGSSSKFTIVDFVACLLILVGIFLLIYILSDPRMRLNDLIVPGGFMAGGIVLFLLKRLGSH